MGIDLNNGYSDLRQHLGHGIQLACYGDPNDPDSITIECTTCMEILLDFDQPDLEYLPDGCECDNTHQAVDSVCRWCWARGRRRWNDPEVADATHLH